MERGMGKDKAKPTGDLQSRIAREQYADYLARYRPQEKQYANRLTSNKFFNNQVARAGRNVTQASKVADATTSRSLKRYGIELDPAQRASMNRAQAFGVAEDRSSAMNTARTDLQDMRTSGLSNMVGFGRNLAAGAGSAAGTAAGLTGARENANNQISAQNAANQAGYQGQLAQLQAQQQSSLFGGVASGAATGGLIGGLPGALIGGGAGLLLGMF